MRMMSSLVPGSITSRKASSTFSFSAISDS
jgi:hypothetical protein